MSVATQLNRIISLRDRLRTKINNLGLDNDPELMLDDCVSTIEGIGGTQIITDTTTYNVAGKQYAQVQEQNLIANNIKRGVSILGVDGNLDFSSWPTAHSGRFSASSEYDYPYHSTSPESISFPLGLLGSGTSWLHQGDLSLNDIEYMIVDCNNIDEALSSSNAYIVGIEFQRDVYSNLGYVIVFKVVYGGRYMRLYSSNAAISFEQRNVYYFGQTYNNVLCLKISAIPESGSYKWKKIDCHNSVSSNSGLTQGISFNDNLWYHIDLKFTN